jgi:hypothetical protein
MKRPSVLMLVFLGLSAALSPAVVFGGNASFHEEVPTFSNKDLDTYKSSSNDTSQSGIDVDRRGDSIKMAARKEQREKDYWCNRARAYRKKIDKAAGEITEAGKDRGGAGRKQSKTAVKKLGREKKQLRDAEIDLRDLEDEAHRKGIPPGWLRCQSD